MSSEAEALHIPVAEVYLPLMKNKIILPSGEEKAVRYKGAHGGRGSGKSHYFAGMAVAACIQVPGTRIVCLREVQRSLRDSVKLLIQDKIIKFGLENHFKFMYDSIRTPGGGLIIFQGLQDHTAETIKSLEGFMIAYMEEAHTITAKSLELLRPTIREPGSQIWASWNPRHVTDPVDALLRGENVPDTALVVEANHRDNPWFPEGLEEERLFDLKYNPIRYNHIWEGDYEPQVVGALWDRAMINQGRVEEPPVLKKTVVSVDPAISSEEHANETGIIGTGLGDNDEGYVLVDESTIGKPESWARRAVAVYDLLEADCIVAESNQGGEMVRSTIKAVRPNVPVTLVHARKGKARRAEPISALYSLGRIHHVGAFPKLEDQMCLMTTEDYHGVGSPDRCDAMVHGFNYLFGPMTRPKGNPNNPRPTRTVSRAPARA